MIAIVCNTDNQFKQLVKNSGKQREVFICVQPESDVSQLEFDQFTVHQDVRVSTTFFKQMTDRISKQRGPQKKTWNEFRETGLAVFVNQLLHIFGWSIIFEVDTETGECTKCYPARTKWRGFSESDTEEAYQKVTKYMADTSQDLLKEVHQ